MCLCPWTKNNRFVSEEHYECALIKIQVTCIQNQISYLIFTNLLKENTILNYSIIYKSKVHSKDN